MNGEKRLWGRGSDFAEIKVHPWSKDVVWVANTSTYRSRDGGKTFEPVRGRHALRCFGDLDRSQFVCRLVDKCAREVLRFADDATFFGGGIGNLALRAARNR